MIQGIDEHRIAHSLLVTLENSRRPVVTLFYDTYAMFFSPGKLKPLEQIDVGETPMLVKVERESAIRYLKNQYQFLTREELASTLQEAAKDFHHAERQ